MARARKLPPGAGHNHRDLTDEEAEALGVHHQLAITQEQRKLDAMLVDVSNQRKLVNGNFKRMTADLGYTRKDFQTEVLDKLQMTEAEYRAHVAKVDKLHRIAGLKQGEQLDLIEHVLNDTVDEAAAAELDGYRAGRRADDPVAPSHVAPILHPDWLRGWHAGQEFNVLQLGKAKDILARPKPGEMVEADPEDEEEDDDEALDDAARKLKASGWTAPTADEEIVDNFGGDPDKIAAE